MKKEYFDLKKVELKNNIYNKVYNNKERVIKLKKLQILFDGVNLIKRDNDSNYLIDLIFLIIETVGLNLWWIYLNHTKS